MQYIYLEETLHLNEYNHTPVEILSRLQSLTPIRPIPGFWSLQWKCQPKPQNHVSEILKEFYHLQSNSVEREAHVTDKFDGREFLRQFDNLQSDNVDIMAWALELSSIPIDSNNNDLVSHAMKLSEINGDIDIFLCAT